MQYHIVYLPITNYKWMYKVIATLNYRQKMHYCIVLMTINELSQTIVNAIGLCLGFSNMMGG